LAELSEPPFAPATSAKQRAAILAQLAVAIANAALKMNQTSGLQDHGMFALIAGDLFEELVNALEVQVKTTDHVALQSEIVEWSRIHAKQLFVNHPLSLQEIDLRAFGRHERFLEDVIVHFSQPEVSAEVGHTARNENGLAVPPTFPKQTDLGGRLDELVLRLDISHEELADRIKLSRSTYFEVKAGRGGRSSRRKVEAYLAKQESDR
jgi:hypothetical protein